MVVYAFVFGFGSYYLAKLLRNGPEPVEEHAGATTLDKKPKRPLSVPDEGLEGGPGHRRPSRPNRSQAMFGFATEHEGLAFWLPLVWAGLLAVAVAMYVIADGFDLGVGILFTARRLENWRDRMMFSVAPIWDGNETWLILGGGGLFAVFHVAYAILMPALYVPIILMLIALIFRGVAFEFRFKADRSKCLWDNAFHYGSLVATFAQGVVLGAFVQGFSHDGRQFTGGTFDFLTPFSVMTGISLILGYGLLGATWCVMKTTGELEIWARRMALRFLVATIVAMAIVSRSGCRSWGAQIEARWFSWPNIAFLAPVPLITAFVAYRLYSAVSIEGTTAPVLPGDRPVPARLSRPRRSASFPTSCRRTSRSGRPPTPSDSQLFALVGYRHRAADHLRLHGLCLLGLPRQGGGGHSGRRLRPLMAPAGTAPGPAAHRLAWFVLLYCGSALAFAAVVYGLRAIVPR